MDVCCRVTALEGNDFEDDGNGSEAAACEVFIGGLPPDVSDEDVRLAFEVAGPVVHMRLNRRNKTGECKGFGFIRYADASSAERAIASINQARHICSTSVPALPCRHG